uniref:Uncharacterized protein n=1 Tax=Ficedula albicollis TaxID=59894 RepID=A0A803VAK9_FICAL
MSHPGAALGIPPWQSLWGDEVLAQVVPLTLEMFVRGFRSGVGSRKHPQGSRCPWAVVLSQPWAQVCSVLVAGRAGCSQGELINCPDALFVSVKRQKKSLS